MFLWLYDLPNWAFCSVIIAIVMTLGVAGLLLTQPFVSRWLGGNEMTNFSIGTIWGSAIGLFYGIAVGLIAVAVWQGYSDIQSRVSREAAGAGSLYRDASYFPEPTRSQIREGLREYTRFNIEKSWPAMRRGQIDPEGSRIWINGVTRPLLTFEARTVREQVLQAEALKLLNTLTDLHRQRLEMVEGGGLPASLWAVILCGAVVNLGVSWLLVFEKKALHILLVMAMSVLLGMMIYMIAVADRPFRGALGIGSDSYQLIYHALMTKSDLPEPVEQSLDGNRDSQ
jgi:hypothetical protein